VYSVIFRLSKLTEFWAAGAKAAAEPKRAAVRAAMIFMVK